MVSSPHLGLRVKTALVALIALSCNPSLKAQNTAPNLGNGFQYGMTPSQAVDVLKYSPGIKDARVSGSKRDPDIKVYYINDGLERLGFHYKYKFKFTEKGLFWVDLEGYELCERDVNTEGENISKKLSELYGKPDGSGTMHVGATDIFVLSELVKADAARAQQIIDSRSSLPFEKMEARMALIYLSKCNLEAHGHTVVRYKGSVIKPIVIDESIVRQEMERKNAKEAADLKALALPH